MAWLSIRFHKENSGRITYLTKVRFFHERYCTRVTLKNNKWWSLLTEFFSSQPANWYPSLILFDEYWVGQVKLNLEFRKLQTSLHTQIKFIWSLWRENPLSRKKMFEFFLFLNGNDTFWPSWRVHDHFFLFNLHRWYRQMKTVRFCWQVFSSIFSSLYLFGSAAQSWDTT